MRKFRLSTMAVVAVAVVPMLTTQASAATTTYTVKAGSAPASTTVPFTLTSQGSAPSVRFHDSNTNQPLPNCATVNWLGSFQTGSHHIGALGVINGNSTTWSDCVGPLNLRFTWTGSGTWRFLPTSYSSGTTPLTLSGVAIHVADGSACKFDIAGSSVATYTSSTQLLAFNGATASFKITGVSGCWNTVREGDSASLTASFELTADTSAYNPVTVTSP